jgi:hypothetical protein
MASAILKFKPSESTDVVGYNLYIKPYEAGNVITKENATQTIALGLPVADSDGYIKIQLETIPEIAALDGFFDLGVSSIDEVGNASVLLTQGLANIDLDFVAPVPPTDGSVYYV